MVEIPYSIFTLILSWIFKNFVSDRGENKIRRWMDGLPKKVIFKIDGRIRYLQAVSELKYPYVEKWKGADDLYEVRIAFAGVMYRILGCYGNGREFILLVGAIEKDWKLEPKEAVTTALARMQLITYEKYTSLHFEEEN